MTLRAWLERGAIVIAALATIATSRKGWVVEAPIPPNDPATARILVVEGSHTVVVSTDTGEIRPLEPTTWPGTGRFLVRSGVAISQVLVSEKCSGSMCKKCEAPRDAKVRVVSLTPVQTWTLQTTKAPDQQPTQLEAETWTTYKVLVDASHTPRLSVTSSGATARVSRWGDEFHVDFDAVNAPTSVTWSVTATLEEPCADMTKPCTPPPDARVEIKTIVREVQNAP